MKNFARLFLLFSAIFFLNVTDVAAENLGDENTPQIDFNKVNQQIATIDAEIKKENISATDIDQHVNFLNQQETEIVENRKVLEKRINFIQKQLDALGEKPADEISEDSLITTQREELKKELIAQDRTLKEADLLIVKIEDLTVQVLNARNKQVYGNLITKQSALINPLIFLNGIKLYVIFFWDLVKSPIEWYQSIPLDNKDYTISSIVSFSMILTAALALALILRKYILNNWGYCEHITVPTFTRKLLAAIAVAAARGLIPSFFIGGCILWMVSTQIFNDSFFGQILTITAYISLFAISEATISRVTFAPNYEAWRLVNISTSKATQFTRMIFLFIILNAIILIQISIAQQAEYSIETIHFLMVIACAIKAFFLMWLIKICFDNDKPIEGLPENEDCEEDSIIDKNFKIVLFNNLLCSSIFAISLFGYPELSLFILNRIIYSLIICGLFELVRRSIFDILKRIIFSGPWSKRLKINKKTTAKIEFWLKILINPILVLAVVFTLLNLWGLPGDFIMQTSKKILFGFKIGGIEISLISIIFGILVFFASLSIVRLLKNHLSNNVFDKIDMDSGIKHSLISGVGFFGFIIATLLAIVAIGVDLTNLAFIAGALSVGVGFGLQDVIKNLVAGIIILFERPFKVGDWVILNGTEGKIKQINIRSTEMESFNRTSIIVPNATLISDSVTNLTHGDNISRQIIKVQVAYGSDVEKVRDILLECAKKNKLVTKNPAPYVLFQDFDASGLNFELRCYTNNIWEGWLIPSELRFAINKRFIEEGIEIPFPQIVVHSGDKVSDQSQFYAIKKNGKLQS